MGEKVLKPMTDLCAGVNWACWRESVNMYTTVLLDVTGCCFARSEILGNESVVNQYKLYGKRGIETSRGFTPSEWYHDRSIKFKDVLFVMSKVSKSKEKFLAETLCFICSLNILK